MSLHTEVLQYDGENALLENAKRQDTNSLKK